jgi:hypothetical protein
MNQEYIIPNLDSYKELTDLLNAEQDIYRFNKSKVSIEDIAKQRRAIVLGEPGYGKTRLLQEIVKKDENNRYIIDLKNVKNNDLESHVENRGVNLTTNTIICLDALDEINNDLYQKIIYEIRQFSNNHPDVNLIITCRTHFYDKWKPDIDVDMYYNIGHFNKREIATYLKNNNISEGIIDGIFNKFKTSHSHSIISTPRYLKLLTDYLRKNDSDSILDITKSDLFKEFIENKLNIEIKKRGLAVNNNILIQRIQQVLALLMEISQTNIISEDEFWTIIDEVESKMMSYDTIINTSDFWDRTILKKNADNTVEFENTEFQEFLAAREIIRLNNSDQVIYDLIFDNHLKEIKPSWLNAVKFLLDMKPDLYMNLIKQNNIFKQNSIVSDTIYNLVLNNSRIFKETESDYIFSSVLSYYQDNAIWIKEDIAKTLSTHYSNNSESLIRKSINGNISKGLKLYVRRGNAATIIKHIISNNSINRKNKEYWKKKLIEWITSDNKDYNVLARICINAIGSFKNIELIKRVESTYEKYDKLYKQEFLRISAETDANSDFTLNYMFKAFTTDDVIDSFYSRELLRRVKTNAAFKTVLEYCDNKKFLLKFINLFNKKEYDYNEDFETNFVKNLNQHWNDHIEELIHKVIFNIIQNEYIENGTVILPLIEILKENNDKYVFKFIKTCISKDINRPYPINYLEIIARLLSNCNVSEAIDLLNRQYKSDLEEILFHAESIHGSESTIINRAKQIVPDVLKQLYIDISNNPSQNQINEKNNFQNHYNIFHHKLEPKKGYFETDVFDFFLRNFLELSNLITDSDKDKLIVLINNCLNIDITNLTVTIKEDEYKKTFLTVSNTVPAIGKCIELIAEHNDFLKIDIKKYKLNILRFIPFACMNQLQSVFDIIGGNISKEDAGIIMQMYSLEREDDLITFQPNNIIKAAEKYNIRESKEILKLFCKKETQINYDHKINALKTLSPFMTKGEALEYFTEIFNTYIDDDNEIAYEANAQLISKCGDIDAFNNRFDIITKTSIDNISTNGELSPPGKELELRTKRFANELLKFPNLNIDYYKKFERLLFRSIKVENEGKPYSDYASYLRDIFCDYIELIKKDNSYEPIIRYEKWILENDKKGNVNWQKYKIHDLKSAYMDYLAKNTNIRDSITFYNDIKKKRYNKISSDMDILNDFEDIIKNDIYRWGYSEGGYKLFYDFHIYKKESYELTDGSKKAHEEFIQKTIKAQIELGFLRRGYRESDLHVLREPQCINDKKPDFIISYGISGSIIVEIKLSTNDEIKINKNGSFGSKCETYKDKLIKYPEGVGCKYGVLLVVSLTNDKEYKNQLIKLNKLYSETNIKVIDLSIYNNTTMKLHEAIIKVLKNEDRGMTYAEIAEIINGNRWYVKEDSSIIKASQIKLRVEKKTYKKLFRIEDGVIYLS